MSDLEPVPVDVDLARGDATLAVAARQLRAVRSPRAVQIADRVLARTLATPRHSRPVRGRSPHHYLTVSTLVIIAKIREHLDAVLLDAAVGRIVVDVGDDRELTAITVELYVRYGTEIAEVADRARLGVQEALARTLGPADPDSGDPVLAPSHVHVSDVTVADPHLVDPRDE